LKVPAAGGVRFTGNDRSPPHRIAADAISYRKRRSTRTPRAARWPFARHSSAKSAISHWPQRTSGGVFVTTILRIEASGSTSVSESRGTHESTRL
jgi:hypothetical protein